LPFHTSSWSTIKGSKNHRNLFLSLILRRFLWWLKWASSTTKREGEKNLFSFDCLRDRDFFLIFFLCALILPFLRFLFGIIYFYSILLLLDTPSIHYKIFIQKIPLEQREKFLTTKIKRKKVHCPSCPFSVAHKNSIIKFVKRKHDRRWIK
jgi:hypothetical protein